MGHIEPAHKTALWNPFANMATLAGKAITIVRGAGSTVYDADGRAYLDALASLWYCNVGYGRTELADAAAAQMREIAGFQTFEYYTNPPAEALCRRIAELAPMPGAKVFLTPGGGSDAVDTAGKLARAYWRAVGRADQAGHHLAVARLSRDERLRHLARRHPAADRAVRAPGRPGGAGAVG